MKESEIFSYHFYMRSEKMDLDHEIKNCFQSGLGEYAEIKVGRLFPNDYSWYKLWRILNRCLFLNYIGGNSECDIMDNYFASM